MRFVAMKRGVLLEAAIEYAARTGLAEFSMRACAAAVGTSHRMLGYHFGTKDELITAIIDAAAARQRAMIDAFVAARDARPDPLTSRDIDQALEALLIGNDTLRYAPLMAEATFRIARHPGLHHGDATTYAEIVALWAPSMVPLFGLENLPEPQREARLRLAVAVLVGLSVDFLGTRDARAYLAAYREWIRLVLGI